MFEGNNVIQASIVISRFQEYYILYLVFQELSFDIHIAYVKPFWNLDPYITEIHVYDITNDVIMMS